MKTETNNISICPNELKTIFKSVNELPHDLKKFEDDLNELLGQYNKEYLKTIRAPDNKLNYSDELLQKDLLKVRLRYDKKLRQIITPKLADLINMTVERNGFQNVRFRLCRLINEKLTLLNIIGSFRVWDVGYNRQMILKPPFNLDKALSGYSFNEDTSLELLSFEVLRILTKDKLPIERIRICRACRKNIFWAKRSDSPTCSSRCSNTFNKKKSGIKKRISELNKNINSASAQFEKQKTKFGFEHSSVQKQMELLDKLQNKLQTEQIKYGTL